MTEKSPITPPPELVGQWLCSEDYPWGPLEQQSITITTNRLQNVATQAARWGYQQRVRSGPEWPLVERVADAIAAEATSAGIVNDRPARAAILQVAMWMREQYDGDLVAASVLEKEASK
jgi:hypothetical protein